MMKQIFTKLFSRVAMVAVLGVLTAATAWATDVTFSYSDYTGQGTQSSGSEYTMAKTDVSITGSKFYGNNAYAHFYAGGTITITPSNGATITGITLTASATNYNGYQSGGSITASTGSVSGSSSSTTVTWSGSANSAFTLSNNKQIRWTSIVVTYTGSGSSAAATTTTISASGITNTDVHQGTSAGSLSATVTSGGNVVSGAAVTWSGNNDGVATINASTGAVTLVSAGSVTFTASYAGVANQYQASTATYEMTVTDSTPSTGTNVTFDATEDTGTSPLVKSGVSFACSSGVLNNGSEYRLYKNSETTFSVTAGAITKIVFTGTSSNPASGFATQSGWTTSGNNGTWTGNSSSVSFTASGAQVRATQIVVTVEAGAAPDPTISVDNVSIAYDATSGSIAFTINNEPSPAGTLTAAAETGSWLTLGSVSGSAVPFICTANDTAAERSTTVTLTYIYGDSQVVTTVVTVTQAGNPNIVDNIEDITAAGNYKVKGTIVAKSNRGFIVGDGTGYVYYYNTNYTPANYAIGDKVKLDGSVVAYGGVYEFNNSTTVTAATESNYVAENPTVLTGQEMDTRVASSAASLSSYVQYEGTLSVSGTYYNVTSIDGAQTAKGSISFPLSTDFASLNGKKVKVTGYYVGVSSNQYYNTMIGSIEEVVVTTPTIYANPASITGLDYEEGGSCTAKTVSVSGENLTADIAATLSGSDFEMSLDGTNFTNSLTLAPASGAVAATNISVRLKDGKAIGEYTGTITLSSTGATTVTVSLSGSVTAPEAPNVTWNLSIDETATATEDEMTWTSNYVTMEVAKGTATTNTNNYYPGTSGHTYTSTRFYTNSVLTITPVAGCTILDVVFEATTTSYASALQSSTWTNATATVSTVSNTTVTVTPANGALAVSATIGGTCGFTSVKVHYAMDNAPFITVTPATAECSASEQDGVHTIAYGNLEISSMRDFDVQFYDENGDELNEDPDWIEALVAEQDPSEGEGYVLSYFMLANEGEAARTAYLKVFAMGIDDFVYSNLVTITQNAPVIDYATLPFEFTGGRDGIEEVTGLTYAGLGSDYNSSPKLKFDSTGDWLILKINEAPGMLSFDIQGNGFSGGTFTVQTSADGVTYTDLATFTELSATENVGYGLDSDVRYIKWVYTNKSSGNVGVGNIRLEKPTYTVLNLTEGPAGYWGTIYNSTICYILPAGAQAFTMNASKQLYRLGNGGVIPANTAVVIIADSATIKLDTGDPIGEVTVHGGANILQGSDGTVSANGHQYVLAKKNGVIGFYKFEGTSIPAGKAYYEINE